MKIRKYKQFHATKLNNLNGQLSSGNATYQNLIRNKNLHNTISVKKKIGWYFSGQDGITEIGFTLPFETANKSQKILYETMVFTMIINDRQWYLRDRKQME